MPTERKISGKTYRCCYRYKIWISSDGTSAFREYDSTYMAGGKSQKWFTLKEDKYGNMVVRTKDHGYVRVDELVSACFSPPKPRDYRAQEIYHKDGDKGNCDCKNLGWRPASHIKDTKTGMVKVNVENDVWVYENGDVYIGEAKQSTTDYIYDPDTDRFAAINPHIDINPYSSSFRRYEIEKLMVCADFVSGDMGKFQNPVVLHIDNDWRNMEASNLEYVNSDDPRYSGYMEKKIADMKDYESEMNDRPKFTIQP